MLKGKRFLQNRLAFLHMRRENRDKGMKIAIWVLTPLLIVGLTVMWMCIPAIGQETETFLFIANSNGKIYTSNIPDKEIQLLFSELLKRYPGKEWKVQVDHGYAKRISVLQPLTIGGSSLKKFPMDFIESFSYLFGIAPEEVSYFVETQLKNEKVVTYLQSISGITVLNSHIAFVFKNDYLLDITSRVYPDIRKFLFSTTPNITTDEACNISRNDASKMRDLTLTTLECRKGELLIVPKEYAAFIKNPKDYYLAWKISISSTQALFSYTYFIDSTTGELINKYSNIKEYRPY